MKEEGIEVAASAGQKVNAGKRPLLKLATFTGAIAVVVVLYLFLLSVFRGTGFSFFPALILAGGCFAANIVFLRSDRMSVAAIGLKPVARPAGRFVIGFFSGMLLVAAWMFTAVLLLSPEVKFHAPANLAAISNLVLFYFFNNAGEELAYRAYAFLRLERSYGRATAILATSALFTLLHIQGGMPWVNAIAGVFTTALILAALFACSRSLPLTLGFHCATNIAQDLFGLRQTPVSFVTLEYHQPVANAIWVLAGVAALNLAVFIVALRYCERATGRITPR